MNYARRQQYRRLSHAGRAALGSAGAALLGLVIASAGGTAVAGLLLLAAMGLGIYARHWLLLARRSRVGARSEDAVHRVVDPLRRKGWRVRHSVSWPGGGDIDSVVGAPSGMAFAIETKTRTYDERHLGRVREQATWLGRRRRRRCRNGVLPVLCVVRGRGVQRWERGVLVTSLDLLVPTLRAVAVDPRWPGR